MEPRSVVGVVPSVKAELVTSFVTMETRQPYRSYLAATMAVASKVFGSAISSRTASALG